MDAGQILDWVIPCTGLVAGALLPVIIIMAVFVDWRASKNGR